MPASSHLVVASSGSFLITPSLGLMIWTLLVFVATMLLLRKFAFPAIRDALDRRQKAIEDSIDSAERTRVEAETLLAEYRERLREARGQAEEIVTRARHSAEEHEREAVEAARARGDNLVEQARRDIEHATHRALAEIRDEVTNLTILATEKVTRKTLDSADQRRLVEEALAELDFTALSGSDN
jgi:F-type H+-transporting ATPase subunit b